jgi:ubiquinone/menaquinone biosynthesis C-methylase UbiE
VEGRKFIVKPYLEKWLKNGTPLLKDWLEKENNYLQKYVEKNSITLDIGCGFGRNIKELINKNRKVVGVDYDKSVFKVVKKELAEYKNVSLFLEKAEKLHFKDNTFDYVICMGNTFGDMPSTKTKVLSEMKRVTKKGGKIIISIFSENAMEERIENLKRAGFIITKIKDSDIFTKEGLIAQQFTKEKLKNIFKESGLNVKIIKLNSIAYICKAVK